MKRVLTAVYIISSLAVSGYSHAQSVNNPDQLTPNGPADGDGPSVAPFHLDSGAAAEIDNKLSRGITPSDEDIDRVTTDLEMRKALRAFYGTDDQ
jgi:hypothetical protein